VLGVIGTLETLALYAWSRLVAVPLGSMAGEVEEVVGRGERLPEPGPQDPSRLVIATRGTSRPAAAGPMAAR